MKYQINGISNSPYTIFRNLIDLKDKLLLILSLQFNSISNLNPKQMTENFNFLFQYLEKEEISINKSEFEFQIQSHPDYPSLTSTADTLSFFNIDNSALSVQKSEIDLLPNRYLAWLSIEGNRLQFYLIEKKDAFYECLQDKDRRILSKKELEKAWQNIVLLVEKPKLDQILQSNKSIWNWGFPIIWIGLFLIILLQFKINLVTKFFFMLPLLGILFSIAALKDLFETKSELINNFCNITSSSSCTTVVSSNKWKIFEIISFSDLSMVFFSSQFFGLIAFLFTANTTTFFLYQILLLICSVPVLLISIYYQKFVEKKWCPICLVIISIILLELGYIHFLLPLSTSFSALPIFIFAFVFVSVSLGWFELKKILIQKKTLKEFQFKGSRFMRNYTVFKNNLLASDLIKSNPISEEDTIILGISDAPVRIVLVTNPYCGYCAKAHLIMEELLNKYAGKISFNLHFNYYDYENINPESKILHQKLVSIYINQGQGAFIEALRNWFTNKDVSQLKVLENSKVNELKADQILEKQLHWNKLNHISYTPAIIINGYFFPKQYERSDIKYFIDDLSEDEDFIMIYKKNISA